MPLGDEYDISISTTVRCHINDSFARNLAARGWDINSQADCEAFMQWMMRCRPGDIFGHYIAEHAGGTIPPAATVTATQVV